MRERVRLALAACFYYSGLVGLMLRLRRSSERSLIILNYHQATGKNLRRQLLFLKRHYRLMHLESALEELYAPGIPLNGKPEQHDRRTPLALTFDDGYLDNYTYGLTLARELQIPITIFLIPGYVESGAYFWWLADDYLVDHTNAEKVIVDDKTYYCAHPAERKALAKVIDQHTRRVATIAEREAFLQKIQDAMGTTLPDRQQAGTRNTDLPVNWEEVLEMQQSGWISFGAHTMHHPILAYLSDTQEVQREVQACRTVLEQHLGHPIDTFCYPVGKLEHIGEQGLQAVKAAGYKWAVTTIEEVNTPATDPYLLCRLPGDVEQHWLVMAAELAGLLGIISRFRKKYGKFFKR